jgi:predicted AAA+ superfamily ATPase
MTMERNQTKVDYKPRIADGLLERALHTSGAAQIVGPKWCGKTTTAERAAKKAIYFQDPDNRSSYLRLSQDKPSLLLEGEKPLLLDEWQDAPVMWDAVRFAVDRNNAVGQFILTGSSVPPDKEILHSGAGRFSKIRMRSMSLFESGESNGTISLHDLFDRKDVDATCSLTLEDGCED